jgi:hypothetical protein
MRRINMEIFNTQVFGFRAALRSMRNPRNGWYNSDTMFGSPRDRTKNGFKIWNMEPAIIGSKDEALIKKLVMLGEPHCKFLRFITVHTTFVLPRYIWQDVDTYKVATVRNSCSTRFEPKMRDFDFEKDFQFDGDDEIILAELGEPSFDYTVAKVNEVRKEWADENNTRAMLTMKRMLPEGYLQRADYCCNYSTVLNMVKQRFNHALPEFNARNEGSLVQWGLSLPYMKKIFRWSVEGVINKVKLAEQKLESFDKLYEQGILS